MPKHMEQDTGSLPSELSSCHRADTRSLLSLLQVRIKLKHMELEIRRRETSGAGAAAKSESGALPGLQPCRRCCCRCRWLLLHAAAAAASRCLAAATAAAVAAASHCVCWWGWWWWTIDSCLQRRIARRGDRHCLHAVAADVRRMFLPAAETVAKYEIMDGAPVRGECIPIR